MKAGALQTWMSIFTLRENTSTMGIFGNVFKGTSEVESFTPEESFVGLITAVSAADGDMSDEEVQDIVGIIGKSKMLQNISEREYNRLVDNVFNTLRKKGVGALVDMSVAGLPEDMRESVFALMCDVAYADGYIDESEEALLEDITKMFGIQLSRAQDIIAIISLKNQV